MSEFLASIVLGLIVLIPVVVFVRQHRLVRDGARAKPKAVALFFCFSLAPVLAYVLLLLALVAIEEVTGAAVVGEGFARTFLPVVAIGVSEVVLLTAVFAVKVAFIGGSR